jgi:hypothetical protein
MVKASDIFCPGLKIIKSFSIYRYAKLRSVITRIFEAMKKWFKVLEAARVYPLITQAQLVAALAAVHNVISKYDPEEILDEEGDVPSDIGDSIDSDRAQRERAITSDDSPSGQRGPPERRDSIARALWADHEAKAYRG